MVALLSNRWFQVSVTGIIAAVVFTALGFLISSGDPEESLGSKVGPVVLATGGTVEQSSGSGIYGVSEKEQADDETTQGLLPLTVAEAVAGGWIGPVLCSVGRGRYFQQGSAGEADPYLLMYNQLDELIGVYLYNKTEMPLPWQRLDELKGAGLNKVVDFEHWGLFVYFQDPAEACAGT